MTELRNGAPVDKDLVLGVMKSAIWDAENERREKLSAYHKLGDDIMALNNIIYVTEECMAWLRQVLDD